MIYSWIHNILIWNLSLMNLKSKSVLEKYPYYIRSSDTRYFMNFIQTFNWHNSWMHEINENSRKWTVTNTHTWWLVDKAGPHWENHIFYSSSCHPVHVIFGKRKFNQNLQWILFRTSQFEWHTYNELLNIANFQFITSKHGPVYLWLMRQFILNRIKFSVTILRYYAALICSTTARWIIFQSLITIS